MIPGPVTLHIVPTVGAIEALEAAVTTATSPAEIADLGLRAATAAVPCSGGALLLATDRDGLEVAATTVPEQYAVGSRPGEPPPRSRVFALRARGSEFGRIVLLDAVEPVRDQARAIERVLSLVAILGPIVESDALRGRLAESNAIVEVGQVLTGVLAMDEVLSYVVHLAESLVRGQCAAIALLSEDRETLVLRNSTGCLGHLEGRAIPVEGSLIGWVLTTGQPVVTPSISDDPRSYDLPTRQGPGVVVPVQVNGETLGSFLVARLENGTPFTTEDLATLQRMSAYAAIAINNAQLYREQMDIADALRDKAGELENAYSELNRQHEQLIIAEKMAALGRVTAGIAHEINSPLAGIMNSLRTARGYIDEYRASAQDPEITPDDHVAIADDMSSALTLAETAVAKVSQFVRSIKAQTRPGSGPRAEFDPAAEVDATLTLLQHRLVEEQITLRTAMEPGIKLVGDQGRFALVVQNLIANAIDACEGRRAEVEVRLRSEASSMVLEVEDNGCGIPEEIRGRIFDFLFTTKEVGKGTGLGLPTVHTVVTKDFGGRIDLESEVGTGTTFRLTLPLNPAND